MFGWLLLFFVAIASRATRSERKESERFPENLHLNVQQFFWLPDACSGPIAMFNQMPELLALLSSRFIVGKKLVGRGN